MKKVSAEKLPFSKFDHVGVIVRDMDKAVEFYHELGMGPFESRPSPSPFVKREVYGRPADDVQNAVKIGQMGELAVELVQPVSGKSTQKEFLEKHGEGINHLGFMVADLDGEVAKLVKKGFKVISSGKRANGLGFAYLDTDKVGGVVLELCQYSAKPL